MIGIEIGAKHRPTDAAEFLDFDHALGRDVARRPAGDRALVNTHSRCDLREASAVGMKKRFQITAHAAVSCATCNSRQAAAVRNLLTTWVGDLSHADHMSEITRIHSGRQPRRPHFIPAWAEKRNLTQADIAREVDADKSLVSRWFSGSTPSVGYQERLAALFACTPDALFRDPDEDWIAEFLRGRSRDEKDRVIETLKVAFPRRA